MGDLNPEGVNPTRVPGVRHRPLANPPGTHVFRSRGARAAISIAELPSSARIRTRLGVEDAEDGRFELGARLG